MNYYFCTVVLSVLRLTRTSEARTPSAVLTNYQQRIEEIRRLVNKSKSPLKTKRYKCVEIDDFEQNFDANNRLWPADDGGASRRSQIMLQMHEHTDGSSSFSEQIVLSQLAPPKWQRTSDRKQPVTVEMSKTLLPSTQTSAPTAAETPHSVAEHGPATRDSFIDSIPRAHVIPQPQIVRQPPTLEEHEVPASARNAQHRPNLRPPLILSPQHCAQIKHYANMYAIVDVKKWVSRNCSFAKMYLPNATCDEINILVASCNL